MTEQTNTQFNGNPNEEGTLGTASGVQSQAQLQLSDLLLACQAIQLASQRGAYRADEFTQVGGAYERIVTFLQANNAIRQVTPEEVAAAQAAAQQAEDQAAAQAAAQDPSKPLTGTPAAE